FIAEHAVNSLEFLPLVELDAEVRFFLPFCSVHAWGVLLVEERVACLAEDIGGKSARDAVFWASITSHSILREKFDLKHEQCTERGIFPTRWKIFFENLLKSPPMRYKCWLYGLFSLGLLRVDSHRRSPGRSAEP